MMASELEAMITWRWTRSTERSSRRTLRSIVAKIRGKWAGTRRKRKEGAARTPRKDLLTSRTIDNVALIPGCDCSCEALMIFFVLQMRCREIAKVLHTFYASLLNIAKLAGCQ